MQNAYSLWIAPSPEVTEILSNCIGELSKKYETPVFEPHMTLLGNILGDETSIIEKTKQFADSLPPFPLTLGEVSFSTTYFQSVFVRIISTSALMHANMLVKEIFAQENKVFMPHISLLYGTQSMKLREQITRDEIHLPDKLSFLADKIVITPATDDPTDWKHIAEIPLKK